MNRKYKCNLAVMLIMILVFSMSSAVHAAGTSTIAVSKSSLEVGSSVNVTVQSSEQATMNVKFNAGVLTFVSCDASGYTTSGNVVTFTGKNATIKFNGAAEGKSSIIVSSDTVSGSSTSVNVAAAATVDDTPDTTQVTGQFTIDGTAYVVSERFTASEIPAGFTKTKIAIAGGNYNELSNGSMTLVYLKPASNTRGTGTFYRYNEADNSMSPLSMVGTKDKYVILMTPADMLTDTFQEAVCNVNDKDVTMYQIQGGTNTDFYYAYGINENNVEGWYQYDASSGSIDRVNTELVTASNITEEDTEEAATPASTDGDKEKLNQYRFIIAGLIFLIVALLIIVINMKLAAGRGRDDEEAEDSNQDMEDGERAITLKEATAESDAKIEKAAKGKKKWLNFNDASTDEAVEEDIVEEDIVEEKVLKEEVVTQEPVVEEETVVEEPEEEPEEKEVKGRMTRKERRLRRRLEEDIFADYDEAVPEKKTGKKSGKEDEDTKDREVKQIEVLDLNDL